MTEGDARAAARSCGPRLTPRGAAALAAAYLVLGPTSSFGFGIPLSVLTMFARSASGIGEIHAVAPSAVEAVETLLGASAAIVIGLPFYAPWAETHLWPVAAWVACAVLLVATSRRGLRVGDAALAAAAAVLAFPALVDADSPQVTWGYPEALYMALAACGGAALCTALVRGFGEKGMRRRRAWGWIA